MPQTPRAGTLPVLLALVLLAGCVSTGDPAAVAAIPIDRTAALTAANAFRAENDLPPLTIDARLVAAAAEQTTAMAARGVLGHNVAGPLPRRLTRVGYDWAATAENIGRGYADYPAAMAGWIGSPEHRRNLLNPKVTQIGFAGSADTRGRRNYWAQIFGTERVARAPSGGIPARP